MTEDVVYFWSKLCSVDTDKLKLRNILFVTVWRHVTHTGQFVYCGTEAEWTIGSCKANQQGRPKVPSFHLWRRKIALT